MNRPITLCSTLLLLFLSFCVKAQNLVYNGDFEQYSSCPVSFSQTGFCLGWRQYHNGSSDFFNSCATSSLISVPNNYFGTQAPASGNGYVGGYCLERLGYREYVAGIMSPMSVGNTYEISMSVSLADSSTLAINGLGIWFYDNGPSVSLSGTYVLPVTPQVLYRDTITDKANWVRLRATFVADSAYDNLVIGDFLNSPDTVSMRSGSYRFAYYYFDSIVVKELAGIYPNFKDTALCVGDSVIVPFIFYHTVFNSANTFTLQLSDDTGSFLHPTNIATLATNQSGTLRGIVPTTFSSGTRYRFRVTSSSPVDSSAPSGYVTIYDSIPAKPVAGSNAPVCAGDTLKLNISSTTAGLTYNWKSANVYLATGANPYVYPAAASYTGQYIATAWLNGCRSSDTINVTVKPQAVFTPSYNTPLCQSDTLKLSATNYTGASYSWSGPNSYSDTVQNPSRPMIGFADTGYYVGTSVLNGCIYKDSIKVGIKPLPQNFSIISNNPQCQGNTLSMNGSTTSTGVTWAWSGPGSYSSTSQNISFANAQPSISGNYILAATLNGCTARDTLAARVIAIPAVPNPSANTPVCVGQTLSLNAGSTGPSYLWSGPNSFVSTSQTPSISSATTALAGTYTVKAIDGGCISADGSVTVNVIAAPTAGMYPSPKDSICQGSPVTFNGFASNAGTGYAIRWFRNSLPISGATGTQYTDAHTADYDSYYCTVTSNGTCAIPYTDTSNIVVMRVFPWLTPSVSITTTATGQEVGGDLISFTSTPVNGGNYPSYQWKRNNKNEIGALSYTWGARTLSDKDVVCVEMTSSYLCPQPKTAMSNCITVRVNTTGIVNTERMQGVKIYPNPVTDELKIEGITTGTEITITDVLGRTVLHNMATNETETIHTATWANGTYLLQLNAKDSKHMAAIVVKQ